VDAFDESITAYLEHGSYSDEYAPISQTGHNMTSQGIGYTVIDALDTMLLLNLTGPYQQSMHYLKHLHTFDVSGALDSFELTIRMLGGLLTVYHMTNGTEPVLIEKAIDLADRLMGAFDTVSGLPKTRIDLHSGTWKTRVWTDVFGMSDTHPAAIGTMQLEFKYLSHLTKDTRYQRVVERVMDVVRDHLPTDGLVSTAASTLTGQFTSNHVSIGALADSYFEYLLKQWLQTNKTQTVYLDMYTQAMDSIHAQLLLRSQLVKHTFVADRFGRHQLQASMHHLVCFLGGLLALGSVHSPFNNQSDLETAKQLGATCYSMYNSTLTGLSPETMHFYEPKWRPLPSNSTIDMYTTDDVAQHLLRPEAVETLYYLWKITGDVMYREWGWTMFQSLYKHARITRDGKGVGFSSIEHVNQLPVKHMDRMETFFLAETCKYFYLLFSNPKLVPLDAYVFNTEAHPLPIYHP
jgi:mannosyl-oligosaccharide alpha-1,2-mannosidase